MDGAGISALGPVVGLSGLPDPMGDATAQLEARRRQQVQGAGYDPDKGLYDRYSEMLGVLGPTIAERARAAADAMRRGDMATYQKIATDLSMDFGSFLGSIKPIRAYHGSPHDFDKFSMDKIGSGEGAQAYGHGLYFAENEGVARSYRDALADSTWTIGGRPYDAKNPNHFAAALVHEYGSPDKAVAGLKRAIAQEKLINADWARLSVKQKEDAIKRIVQGNLEALNEASHGRMYEVNIHADPKQFLDWDKPLGDQSEQVRRALGWTPAAEKSYRSAQSADTDALLNALLGDARYVETRPPVPKGLPPLSATGGDILKGGSVFDRASDPAKSAALRDAGIPGIKYLDQGSRAAGDGSRNYVVFDDKLIEILRKYGIMAPVAGAGIGSLYMGDEEGM